MPRTRTTLLALITMALTLGVLWQQHRVVAPQEATMAEVQAEAAGGGGGIVSPGPSLEFLSLHLTPSVP